MTEIELTKVELTKEEFDFIYYCCKKEATNLEDRWLKETPEYELAHQVIHKFSEIRTSKVIEEIIELLGLPKKKA